jgi:hypothetical protein
MAQQVYFRKLGLALSPNVFPLLLLSFDQENAKHKHYCAAATVLSSSCVFSSSLLLFFTTTSFSLNDLIFKGRRI